MISNATVVNCVKLFNVGNKSRTFNCELIRFHFQASSAESTFSESVPAALVENRSATTRKSDDYYDFKRLDHTSITSILTLTISLGKVNCRFRSIVERLLRETTNFAITQEVV